MGIVVEGRVAKNAGCGLSLNDRSGKSKIGCKILAMYSIHVLEADLSCKLKIPQIRRSLVAPNKLY